MPKVKVGGLGNSKGDVQTGFDPWKPGDYLLEIVSVKWGETRKQKFPQLEVKTQIADVDGENEDHVLVEGGILDVPAGVPHIFLPEEDSLTVEWWEGDFLVEEYDFPEFTVKINKRVEEFERKVEELKKRKK